MTEFVQLHLLTSYPPANLNRDDLGRPKTAQFGGDLRLRVSSQCLKRTWRCSEVFGEAVGAHRGVRTKAMGKRVLDALTAAGMTEKKATKAAGSIASLFGKLESKSVEIAQLAHFSPREQAAIEALTETLAREDREPTEQELAELQGVRTDAADIALFGRMLAAAPKYNVEAAAQVAHAITVHRTAVEDDYFTAVDDLNTGEEDRGAGHVGEVGFGAGVFYAYICIDRDQLVANLTADGVDDPGALADRAIEGLVRAAATVAPKGKQNSFGSRAYASYVLAERGAAQPRSLSVAFLDAVPPGGGYLTEAIERIEHTRDRLDAIYGAAARDRYVIDAPKGTGRIDDLVAFCTGPAPQTDAAS